MTAVLPGPLSLVRFVSVDHMMRIVLEIGVERVLAELASYIEQDFRRWEQFDKKARADRKIVLDVDGATARARMLRRVRPVAAIDRMEQEPLEFYERVREGYRELARREPARIRLLDGAKSADAIENEIWKIVETHLPRFAALPQSEFEIRKSKI